MGDRRVVESGCPMCPMGCLINVHIEDGKIVKVEGVPEDPITQGALCPKAYGIMEFVYAPDRVNYPLRRVGEKGEGKWERISWDDALSFIANKLSEIKEEDGAEAVAFFEGYLGLYRDYCYRLANVFGTPNIAEPTHICFSPKAWAHFFTFGQTLDSGSSDYRNTECILVWGKILSYSGPYSAREILAAKERGAKLIVIDPRFTPLARIADKYVRIRPGTDGALALGMLNVIINEELYDKDFVEKWTVGFDDLKELVKAYPPDEVEKVTWVKADTVREISRMYATAGSACINSGNGLDAQTNSVQSIRAIMVLMAVTGNLDVPGGNVFPTPAIHLTPVALWDKLSPEAIAKTVGLDKYPFMREKPVAPPTRGFEAAHEPSIFDAILTGKPYPIKAMSVWCINPILTSANTRMVREALKKLELLVVVDIFMSPTTKLADIVLPACTVFEKSYFRVNPALGFVTLRRPVIEPLGESWPDIKIITELAKKMGYGEYFPWKTLEEALDAKLEGTGFSFKRPEEGPGFQPSSPKYRRYEEEEGFPTPSKKIEIYSEQLEEHGYNPLPVYREPAESPVSRPDLAKRYPLILTTGALHSMYRHSSHRNVPLLRGLMPENLLEIHPKTAGELGIRDDDMVLVESLTGSIKLRANVHEGIIPGVVSMMHGFEEANCNVLVDNKAREPIIGAVGMKASLCSVRKLGGD